MILTSCKVCRHPSNQLQKIAWAYSLWSGCVLVKVISSFPNQLWLGCFLGAGLDRLRICVPRICSLMPHLFRNMYHKKY